ncbi:TetR/AcrR family transcriptional regulator [Clostridium sp. MSJ-11]|uniref:TetR/AcrR family transcriptional regulator n=1 Tax=Clostridium mobile TaxID=2841512 RepID=A0ABS6EHM7_9CLOT|nr:TetR/AcrR family transcriptional regulator [Clostridium mobile]MBU5484505.1 TetR/AcrR family transcriptional regulator [Clostridium mobile]
MVLKNFLALPIDKQEEIINACIKEFSTYGYDGASTNRIINSAGISKGVLFKYFSNKENLFIYISEKVVEKVISRIDIEGSDIPEDFFDALKFFALKEIHVLTKEPYLLNFFQWIRKHPEHPIYSKILKDYEEKQQIIYAEMISKINTNQIRKEFTLEEIMKVVQWVLEGFNEEVRLSTSNEMNNLQDIMPRLEVYFNILKKGIYE